MLAAPSASKSSESNQSIPVASTSKLSTRQAAQLEGKNLHSLWQHLMNCISGTLLKSSKHRLPGSYTKVPATNEGRKQFGFFSIQKPENKKPRQSKKSKKQKAEAISESPDDDPEYVLITDTDDESDTEYHSKDDSECNREFDVQPTVNCEDVSVFSVLPIQIFFQFINS